VTSWSSSPDTPAAPVPLDVVEIVERDSDARVSAVVESHRDGNYVLRFDRAVSVPELAPVRWYSRDAAWQATARLERNDETSMICRLPPAREWALSPGRQAPRTPVDNASLLVKIISSNGLDTGHRLHTVCVDISDGGCRVRWPGHPPLVGDTVEVSPEIVDGHSAAAPVWIPARVARIIALPFGTRQVGLRFEITTPMQRTQIRAWHHHWLLEHRQHLLDHHRA
jgi:hypothetical protein